VSKNKRRFLDAEYDLDLFYVTPRIIAMGFPSDSVEGLYRNAIAHVQAFFQARHAGRFKIYNLCSEREYDPEKFGGSGGLPAAPGGGV
jgi:phosphatidylinositol-3,4,5-trisphosphate 3-phosphatase/dual-specificity protein phosphatase PTEN